MSIVTRIRSLGLLVVLGLLGPGALPGCGPAGPPEAKPLARVLLVGVDGLEWSVLHPLLADGRCPNLAALMKRGSYGTLGTFIPTWSPVIWTSIATGKTLRQHGIGNFVDEQGREYTSSRREGRALWNIAHEYGLTTNVLGWWITWPVEPIRGLMVSATSASAMADQNWKPALMDGLENQVHPPELEARVLGLARVAGSQEATMAVSRERVFGPLPKDLMSDVERDLVSQTLWSIQSDETYFRLAMDLLPDHPADLNLIYFGGPDVAGHRFWRHLHPDRFQWAGSSPEVDAALADAIPNYYEWVDDMLGQLMSVVGDDVTVIVVSDHGMHEVGTVKPNPRGTSGDHQDGAPGVIVAAGPGIAVQGGVDRYLASGFLAPLGSVMDVTPTVLGLLGIPPSRDMAGRPNRLLLDGPTRDAVEALGQVESHDDGFRDPVLLEVPAEKEAEFVQRMAALGYLDGVDAAPKDSVPVNPATFQPQTGSGDNQ